MDLLTKIEMIFSEGKQLNIGDVMYSTEVVPVWEFTFSPKKNLQNLLKKEQNCGYIFRSDIRNNIFYDEK